MAKNCDICGGKLHIGMKFRCADGIVCKECYGIVSNHYKKTIIKDSIADLKLVYEQNRKPLESYLDDFESCSLKTVPEKEAAELKVYRESKYLKDMIDRMTVEVRHKNGEPEEILLLSSPVRVSGKEFQNAYDLGQKIIKEINRLNKTKG